MNTYTWHELQEKLRACTTEAEVEELMEAERGTPDNPGPSRLRWLMRMQGRLRTLRADRENAELAAASKEP